MRDNKDTQSELKPGTILDIIFTYGSKIVKTNGYVKDSSTETTIIELDVDDRKMTLPVGTDIYVLKEDIRYNVIDSKDFPEIKVVRVDGRKHVRVDDILKIDYKKTSQIDFNKYRNEPTIIFKSIFGESFKAPKIEEVDVKLLYELIYQANLKMDRILEILENREIDRYASTDNKCVNISGSGMRFIANQSFSIGDIIAIRIFLPLAAQTRINVLGEVTSVTESETKGEYYISARFVELSRDDQEMIIKYVFRRQRELLRFNSDWVKDKR